VGLVGERVDLTYPYTCIGAGPVSLADLGSFREVLEKAERPVVMVGAAAMTRPDAAGVLSAAARLAQEVGAVGQEWNGFAVLHTAASRVGGLDVGCVPGEGGRDTAAILDGARSGDVDMLFLLGADEIDTEGLDRPFTVYLGTHGDRGAQVADVILPGAAYTEKSGTLVNLEGRPQRVVRGGFPPGDAREDWAILRALSAELGAQLPYDNFAALNRAMVAANPILGEIDDVIPADPSGVGRLAERGGNVSDDPFVNPIRSYYLTNPIARASVVMAECARVQDGTYVAEAAE
jgi:NADH-quinone oxidoreductase subunit G